MPTEIVPAEPLVESESRGGMLRCLRCKNVGLMQSGREPFRHICERCGQNYHIVMQLVPVPAEDRPALLEAGDGADRRTGTG